MGPEVVELVGEGVDPVVDSVEVIVEEQQFSFWPVAAALGSAGVSPASTSSRALRACRRDAGAPREACPPP